MKHNLIIAITGASGSIYGLRILEFLQTVKNINSHLIISHSAHITIKQELDIEAKSLLSLASNHYNHKDISAPISSGSFKTMGMIIAPCSINTMSAIASGNTNNLITRAADVTLKEGRKLLLVLRETPLHSLHLANLQKLASIGTVIFPPVPAFYIKPKSISEIIDHTIGRILDHFNIENNLVKRWHGTTDQQ